jgi:hypothetical protein
LHDDEVHEFRTFLADAINVGCFSHHQTLMVEEDVGLLLLRGRRRGAAMTAASPAKMPAQMFLVMLRFLRDGCRNGPATFAQ